MIKIFSDSRYKIDKKLIKKKAEIYLEKIGLTLSENINIVFTGMRKMKHIAVVYKKEHTALPVLSFSYINDDISHDEDKTIGEVFICYPQAVLLAVQRDKKVNDVIIDLVEHGISNIVS